MTLRACGFCGRDLPADAHHLQRYCPSGDCATKVKKAAKKAAKRRRSGTPDPEVGEVRKIGRRVVAYLPGHPLASASGWTSAKRAAMYEQLAGADPHCATC